MTTRLPILPLVAWFAISVVAASYGADAPKNSNLPAPVVPDVIKAPAAEVLSFAASAQGVQIYECKAKAASATATTEYEWVLKGPEADLFDAQGKKIGHHYAGPTWESTDGSKVVGELKGKAPSTSPDAIPWLLLSAKAHEGTGVFSQVTTIQRLETGGGKAPATAGESSKGQEVRVPYTAKYYFYVAKP